MRFEFVVIGGGISGVCAVLAAARHGVKTALIQDWLWQVEDGCAYPRRYSGGGQRADDLF